MAENIGNIMGYFEEMDLKEAHYNGIFLRIKVSMDMKQPINRGTMVRFKDKSLRVHFKYERLPTFFFVCGRLGRQMEGCEALIELGEEGYEDLDQHELSYGLWIRDSPLPNVFEEQKRKESSSGTCRIQRTRGGVGRPTPPSLMKILSWNCRGLGNPRAV